MKNLWVASLISAAAFAQSPSERPFEERGSNLATNCKAAIRAADRTSGRADIQDISKGMFCLGYISGFVAYVDAPGTHTMCLPDQGASPLTIARVYLKHLEDNPKALDLPVREGMLAALTSAYRCK